MTNNNFIAVSNICQTITFRKRYRNSRFVYTVARKTARAFSPLQTIEIIVLLGH